MRWRDGNRLALLQSGDAWFPALCAALATAREEVHFETYIFADDRTGRAVAAALAACAARGVAVQLVVDGFGSRNLAPALRAVLEAAGVRVRIYAPIPRGPSLRLDHLRRLHRKLVVIDGRLAFCGGLNVLDDRAGDDARAPRLDFGVRIEGPVVIDIHRLMRRLWLRLNLRHPTGVRDLHVRKETLAARFPDGHPAALVVRDNLTHRRSIEDCYIEAIRASTEDVIIACAYFVPGRRIRHALLAAAARGVRVRLLLQGQPDHLVLHTAARGLYQPLLAGGIEIREYRPAHLHAKVAVIDGQWATVGSSNIDPFSLWLSREANIVTRDPGVVATLRLSLLKAFETEGRTPSSDVSGLPLGLRIRAWCMYRLARIVLGYSGQVRPDEF